MKLTREFCQAIKNSPKPIYVTAFEAGLHGSQLSRLLHGHSLKRTHDLRYKILASNIGFEGPIFETGQNSISEDPLSSN